ncbi:MAG: GH25 family lysozyme [Chitinophagales bacterium]
MAKKKGKRNMPQWARRMLWLGLVLAVTLVAWMNKKYLRRAYRYVAHRYYKTHFSPTDFPQAYAVHGIDISHYQDVLDWNKLIAVNTEGDTIQFRFVFIKATQGLWLEDDLFDEYWEEARDHNMVRGAYHYFLPDRNPRIQAKNFISSVKLEKGDLPPVVDIEETRGKTAAEIDTALRQFLTIVEQHYGVKPIIYSNINFIEDYLQDQFADYPFWIAHYYRDELTADENINWVFWQHSDKADLLGINGKTDANVFNGGEEAFRKLLIP